MYQIILFYTLNLTQSYMGGAVVKNPPANAGDPGSTPGSGRSPGEGNSNPLQYSCLGKATDRGTWWTTIHEVAKSRPQLKQLSTIPYRWTGHFFLLFQESPTKRK